MSTFGTKYAASVSEGGFGTWPNAIGRGAKQPNREASATCGTAARDLPGRANAAELTGNAGNRHDFSNAVPRPRLPGIRSPVTVAAKRDQQTCTR